MRDSFFGYYPPTAEEYETLWKDGIIVPDTNVLLDLYRLPPTARDELIAVLEELKQRLWIPYQVALEFQERRLTVISAERKATESALEAAKALVDGLKQKVEALQIDKHGLGLDPSPLIADLEHANGRLIEAITAVHKQQPNIAASDPIRERLDQILSKKIGPGPVNQSELDELIEGGDQRYADKVPPGYADSDKGTNPNQAMFFHDQIKYQRKFGDLILWRQIIKFAKTNNIKFLMLVTADRKEDWWWREQGRIIGVQPELVREIRREAGVTLFWMYSSVQFLEHAKTYVRAQVSDQAVAELQEVSANPRRTFVAPLEAIRTFSDQRIHELASRVIERVDYERIEKAVHEWLIERYGDVIVNKGFPDFIALREDELHGYDVKFLRTLDRMIASPIVVNSILRGYLEVNENRLTTFTMVLVTGMDEIDAIRYGDKLDEMTGRVVRLLQRYPIAAVVVGAVLSSGHFESFIHTDIRNLPIHD
jgi:hypothetical protein